MRVLVSCTAGSGHLGPLIPFARACQAAGHAVAVAAPASFADQVLAAGFDHRPFADAPPDAIGPIFARLPSMTFDEANDVILADVFGRVDAQASLPGLATTIAGWGPDVVLREPAELGSLAAARVAGVPHATVAIGVSALLDHLGSRVTAPLGELDTLAGLPAAPAPRRCVRLRPSRAFPARSTAREREDRGTPVRSTASATSRSPHGRPRCRVGGVMRRCRWSTCRSAPSRRARTPSEACTRPC